MLLMSDDRTFHIRENLAGQTLAAALRRLGGERSWADAKKLVTGRRVQVNGNLCIDDTRRLKAGEVIKLFAHPRAAVPTSQDVKIRHIDSDLIVVEKPPGMTTLRHAEERKWDDRRRQKQPTLDEVLQQLAPGLLRPKSPPLKIKRGPHGPKSPPPKGPKIRPVHRLDRDTSGLMIFAISSAAEQTLVNAFKKHTIKRSYLAVAIGRVETARIESWISRDRGDGIRGTHALGKDGPEAQHAVTHVRPVHHIGDRYTVIECTLETGRTHQIRIHLAERGHLLCGEKVYVRPGPGKPVQIDPSGAPRQALHSAELEFVHPGTGKTMRFSSHLPRDLKEWLDSLQKIV